MKNNFHYVSVLLDLMYGIEMNDEDLEELGLIAWEKIGNKDVKLYRYSTCIGRDLSVELPCNFESLEAVTTSYEDWSKVTNYSEWGDTRTAYIETSIESYKTNISPYYISGKLLNYELVDNTLYFDRNYGKINILYKGLVLDDEGLPKLTDKEALAIATFLAYTVKYKEGLKTNNVNIIELSKDLENTWNKQCDLARVKPISLNEMNEILDVKTSWDRKRYNISYKPLR